jgi:trans-aconitate 2-methyltransferase
MTREWDAAAYERLSAPQTRWGRVVVDRLELDGSERVLDAGCGTGRVTAMLLELLPDGRVIGLDGSSAPSCRRQRSIGSPTTRCCSATSPRFFVLADNSSPNAEEPATSRRSNGSSPNWVTPSAAGRRSRRRKRREPGWRPPASRPSRPGSTRNRRRSPRRTLEAFLETVCLGGIVDAMADDERERFVHEVLARMPEPLIDYVRLNICARRAA